MKLLIGAALAALSAACAPVDYCDADSSVARDTALLMSADLIKPMLKAPSTAQFPTSSDAAGVSVISAGECVFEVRSYVDAQNSFGAMIRSRYRATVRANPDRTFTLLDGEVI